MFSIGFPGKLVTLEIPAVQLRHFDTKLGDYAIAKGQYEFLVGAASNDIKAKAIISVK